MPKRLLGLKSIQKRVILALFQRFLIDFIWIGFNSEKMVPGKVFLSNPDNTLASPFILSQAMDILLKDIPVLFDPFLEMTRPGQPSRYPRMTFISLSKTLLSRNLWCNWSICRSSFWMWSIPNLLYDCPFKLNNLHRRSWRQSRWDKFHENVLDLELDFYSAFVIKL